MLQVEIDTFWNVKNSDRAMLLIWYRVEIDTFWNVKMFDNFRYTVGEKGRNRYILECKGILMKRIRSRISVEIDTFWNVKVEYLERYIQTPQIVEIDTFWNVKAGKPVQAFLLLCVEIDTFWNVKE